MKRFLRWRKMTWVVLLGGLAMAVWVVGGGFVLSSIVFSLLGFAPLAALWYLSMPLWRQGHGLRLRRLRPVAVEFKSAERLASLR